MYCGKNSALLFAFAKMLMGRGGSEDCRAFHQPMGNIHIAAMFATLSSRILLTVRTLGRVPRYHLHACLCPAVEAGKADGKFFVLCIVKPTGQKETAPSMIACPHNVVVKEALDAIYPTRGMTTRMSSCFPL